MVYEVIVPVPVSGGVGSVTVIGTNSTAGFKYAALNGCCIQIGILQPSGSPSGNFYCLDKIGFLPVAFQFSSPSYTFNGPIGFVGDITINMTSVTVNGVYLIVFIMKDEFPQH